jgi:hypothetical protein
MGDSSATMVGGVTVATVVRSTASMSVAIMAGGGHRQIDPKRNGF